MTVEEKKDRERMLWHKAIDALIENGRLDVIRELLTDCGVFARRREVQGKEYICVSLDGTKKSGTVFENIAGLGPGIKLEEIGWDKFNAEFSNAFQVQKS